MLKIIANDTTVNADAMLEYFRPLRRFLVEEIDYLKREDEIRQKLDQFNDIAVQKCNKYMTAVYDYKMDLDNEVKEKRFQEVVLEDANFFKQQFKDTARHLNATDFRDEKLQRLIKSLQHIGIDALPEDQLAERNSLTSLMEKIYSLAKVCDMRRPNCTKKLSLEPGEHSRLIIF